MVSAGPLTSLHLQFHFFMTMYKKIHEFESYDWTLSSLAKMPSFLKGDYISYIDFKINFPQLS